eukprot:8816485-Pyramimonas_sp.AAC.1
MVEGAGFVLAVVEHLERAGIGPKYEAEVKLMKKHFVKALMTSHLACVDNDPATGDWCDRRSSIVSIVFPAEPLWARVVCETEW